MEKNHSVQKYMGDFRVVANQAVSSQFHCIELESCTSDPFPPIRAGQFVQVGIQPSDKGWLRIPISIHDFDVENRRLSLLVQQVGDGSRRISAVQTGETLNLIYPLGNGFHLPENKMEKPNVLMVGGGCGIAPLYALAKVLRSENIDCTLLVGGRTREQIILLDKFAPYCPVVVCTEDGSCGEKGLVTQSSLWKHFDYTHIYSCGPTPMMKAVAKMDIPSRCICEFSLENQMACGLGACLCCVTPNHEGRHLCVCSDGPVFNAEELGWRKQ